MKISVSMIALNEENFIGRALSSCAFADEIVVVDGGSTDATIQILQSNSKVKIVHHLWEGHFGRQRQISLQHCSGDWVIRLDADEAFSLAFEEKIRSVLETTPQKVSAYRVRQCNLVGNEQFYSQSSDQLETYPRIWRNLPGVGWERSVHEKLTGLTGQVLDWDIYVVHYGFLDKPKFLEKGRRYSQIPGSQVDKAEDLIFRNYDFQPTPERARVGPHVPPYTSKGSRCQKPQIAIVRGPHLNPWEIQLYRPLQDTYDLRVFTTCLPPPGWTETDIPIVRLPEDKSVHTAMNGVEFALFDADILFASQIVWPYTYQAIKAKEKFGKKVIALQWDTTPFAHEENEAIKYFKSSNRELVDVFIADTTCARDALLIEGVPPAKIVVIPAGIDMDTCRPEVSKRERIRGQLGISEAETVVLADTGPGFKNGLTDLVHAAKLIQTRGDSAAHDIRYVISGRPMDVQKAFEKIEVMGLEKKFVYCSDHSPLDLFNAADIFFVPSLPESSWKEPSHMTLRKALAYGLPVIAAAIETIPDLVGEAAILIPQENPGALCAAVMELSEAGRRRTLGQKARRWAMMHFTAEKTIQDLRKLFQAVHGSQPTK